jgi:hypothetical protein
MTFPFFFLILNLLTMYKAEQYFIDSLTNNISDIHIETKSNRNKTYQIAINIINFMLNVILNPATLLVMYEVKLCDMFDKYPDFILAQKNKKLRVEIKDKQNEQDIAKEINSIQNIYEDAFYFFISNDKDINKIKYYSTKKNDKIKIFYLEDCVDEVINFFI